MSNARKIITGFYPIVDVTYSPDIPAYSMAEWVLSSGAPILQFRQKDLLEKEFLNTAMEISYLRIHNDFKLIINHFVEVAKAIGADGVHLGSGSMAVHEARKILGPEALIGASVHSIEEALKKEEEGATYLTFGAIFPTATKEEGHPIQGLEKLRELVGKVRIPVVAIGGIGVEQVQNVKETGAAAFSVITAVSQDPNPAKAALQFYRAWGS